MKRWTHPHRNLVRRFADEMLAGPCGQGALPNPASDLPRMRLLHFKESI
jgi:hypothetical protein